MNIIIYDASELNWLGKSWELGAKLFVKLGFADKAIGVYSGHDFVLKLRSLKNLNSIQYWGHGWAGNFLINKQAFNFETGKVLIESVANSLKPNGVFWLRTCASFAGKPGHALAKKIAEFGIIGVAHTKIIGFFHSPIRILRPGAEPTWSEDEGVLIKNKSGWPIKIAWSTPLESGTKLFLSNAGIKQ